MRWAALALATMVACSGPAVFARGASSSHGSLHSSSHSSGHSSAHSSGHPRAAGVPRDSHGHIKRSEHARNEFRKSHPCPSTGKSTGACPGYVIDHKQALKHGGADAPSNMQWQTETEAKRKDKWE